MKLAEVTAGDSDDKAPIFEYSYEYQGSYSLTDVIVYGVWKLGARVCSEYLFFHFSINTCPPNITVKKVLMLWNWVARDSFRNLICSG